LTASHSCSNFRYKNMFLNFKKNRAWVENLSIVMQIGLTMAGCIVFCFFIGLYLDKWLGTKGVFIVIFIVLGVIGGAVTVYRQLMAVIEKKSEDREDRVNGSS
jgi:ATP synthase protein I